MAKKKRRVSGGTPYLWNTCKCGGDDLHELEVRSCGGLRFHRWKCDDCGAVFEDIERTEYAGRFYLKDGAETFGELDSWLAAVR